MYMYFVGKVQSSKGDGWCSWTRCFQPSASVATFPLLYVPSDGSRRSCLLWQLREVVCVCGGGGGRGDRQNS
jgi:hypothetical protein